MAQGKVLEEARSAAPAERESESEEALRSKASITCFLFEN